MNHINILEQLGSLPMYCTCVYPVGRENFQWNLETYRSSLQGRVKQGYKRLRRG